MSTTVSHFFLLCSCSFLFVLFVPFSVGGLRLRAADLMWYGLMLAFCLNSPNTTATSSIMLGTALVFLSVLSSLAIILFVFPFVGIRYRPLPVAFLCAFIFTLIQQPLFEPFMQDGIKLIH